MYGGVSKNGGKNNRRKNNNNNNSNSNNTQQYQQVAMNMINSFNPFMMPVPMPAVPGNPQPPKVPPPSIPQLQNTNPMHKWASSLKHENVPDVSTIKSIDIYDFDNTLFRTPHPNPDLFCTGAIGVLESINGLQHGGWWGDSRFLQGTGQGYKHERAVAWEGWWNEQVVDLVKLSIADENTLTVLLTGRRNNQFKSLMLQMLESKGLEFDAVILRPDQTVVAKEDSTLQFKTRVIEELVKYYSETKELRIYEDRPKQAVGFRKLLKRLAENNSPGLMHEVVEVYEEPKNLDPYTERTLVESVVNSHNEAFAKGTLAKACRYGKVDLVAFAQYSGYLLTKSSTAQVLGLLDEFDMSNRSANSLKYEGSVILSKDSVPVPVGGEENRVFKFLVTHVGQCAGTVWAAKVQPVDETHAKQFNSLHSTPLLILAIRRKTNPTRVETIEEWRELPTPLLIETRLDNHSLLKLNARKR